MRHLENLIARQEAKEDAKIIAIVQFVAGVIGVCLLSYGLDLSYTVSIGIWLVLYALMPLVKS